MILSSCEMCVMCDPSIFPMQAKVVAAATSNLCESANLMVQGQAEEDKLIVAAKAVAASTAQLLIACQVKADARSENNKRLQVCGCGLFDRP